VSLLSKWTGERKALTVNYLPDVDEDGTFTGFYIGGQATGAEEYDTSFVGAVETMYKANGIVFACILARQMPFSEARFQLQEIVDGRPGKLRNHPSLDLLSTPWPNGTTGELLSRMEQDASLAGNFYATTVAGGTRIRRLRPDWIRIVSGVRGDTEASPFDLEAEPLLYLYHVPGRDPVAITPERMVHYAPIPDPLAQWRGMSWLTPLVREVRADQHATTHKLKFFENGAALSTAITYDPSLPPENFRKYVALFEAAHRGPAKAYRTLHIGGGADVTAIGTELKTDFKAIQGAGETRIAAAAGVGAIIARFSEGLAGSSLNQGNYSAAKRQVADMTLRPLWRAAAASLAKLVEVPPTDRLWYDVHDVEFLKEDRKDAAEIRQVTAATIKSLVDAGFTPESVLDAVETDDLTRLKHSGLYSVQLQSAGLGDSGQTSPEDLALILQKIYLAVDKVITREEAREIVNRAGAGLGPLPASALSSEGGS
jgi:phage portal protein BeeE